jgi:hypothetical protein
MQKTTRFVVYILTFLVISSFVFVSSKDFSKDKRKLSTLDEFDLVARGKMSQTRGMRPAQIARMDNNGEILFACVEPKTVEQLISIGIEFQRSQMELLLDWNLLEYDRKNKTYRTTIHVYGAEKAAAIRRHVKAGVKQLADALDGDLASLRDHLAEIDKEKSMFAILYAYVLHSYAMNQFGKEIYQKPQLSEENPFWNGYVWAIYPIKKFPTSVFFMPVEGNQFFFVSAAGVPRLDFKQINGFVKDVSSDNKIDDLELKKSLSAFDLCDNTGKLSIPIFERDWPTKLEEMAKTVYAKTIELADSEKMKDILGMETQAQAAMFLHYEIRYAFLDYVLEKKLIKAPIDFKNRDNNSPTDMKNLVFWIKTEKSN